MYATIHSLSSFGTSCITYDPKKEFRFHPIQTIFFEENSSGVPDVVFKLLQYNKRQSRQEFESAGPTIEAEESSSTKIFDFIHCVFPNDDYDDKVGSKKFASVFIQMADKVEVFPKGKTTRGGYDKQLYKIARMPRGPKGLMGEAPGKDLLPTIKMLNSMQESYIRAKETMADPTLVVSDDGVVGQPITGPGGLVVMRAGSEKPYFLTHPISSQDSYQDIVLQQQVIKDGFFNNIFVPLQDQRNMTATEVQERVNEGLTIAAPIITPLNKEILDPLITQVLEDLPKGSMPPKPPGLKVKIVYQGRLALAMSNLHSSAIERSIAKWAPMQELYPVLDNIDMDKSYRISASNDGVPAEALIPVDIRDATRNARNEAAQAEQQVALAETASKALKNVGSIGA